MDRNAGRGTAGVLLIVLGFGLFLLQFVDALGGSVTLAALGGLFLFFYFTKKSFGYLVPGCILAGIGFGMIGTGSGIASGEFGGVGLGLGFLAIFIIRLLYERENTWWPLVPGIILLVNALGRSDSRFGGVVSILWPLLFVLLGIWVLVRRGGKGKAGGGEGNGGSGKKSQGSDAS